MKNLAEMFCHVARVHAARPAIVTRGAVFTYADLEDRVVTLAQHLAVLGAGAGDRLAVLLPNSVEFVTSFFAIQDLGGIVVPLNEQYEQIEISSFIDECGVSFLLTSQKHKALCERVILMCQSPCRLIVLQGHDLPRAPGESVGYVAKGDLPALYQYSSGSTGRPKLIARTHTQLLFELEVLRGTLDLTPNDRLLGVAPFSHVNGLTRTMLACVYAGGTLYPLEKFERNTVAEMIERHQLTVSIAVPFIFSMLAQTNFARSPDFSSLRWCISASAAMPKRFNSLFQAKFGMYVRQLYGSTETGTISLNVERDLSRTLESVGIPIPGVSVKICDDRGHDLSTDQVGEIVVSSPAAIREYASEELVDQSFRDGFFLTGDLGRMDKSGMLYLVGRKKYFINKGGYKINPHQVEQVLMDHPSVQEVVVVGVPTAYGDERVKAIVVLSAPCTPAELVEFCRGRIAAFKIPSIIEFREQLPVSPTGKVRRHRLVQDEY